MADIVSAETRSEMMAGIKGKNTRPELMVRSGLHAAGFRYRLHSRGLPGKPDIVLHSWRAVLFVNGCFWHKHDCHLFKMPSSRTEFWESKITRNVERDCEVRTTLQAQGWRVGTVWECALKGKTRRPLTDVITQLSGWIKGNARSVEIMGSVI